MSGDNSDNEGAADAPKGHKLRFSRQTTLRFASSRLNLLQNPAKQPGQGEEGEHLIHPSPPLDPSPGPFAGHSRHASQSGNSMHGHGGFVDDDEEEPLQFNKRHSASNAELFYDLFFVANLTVFASLHEITESSTLLSFCGFFILLWITWFMTSIFDARFGQDGIVERFARAFHLATMVGFAVASVSFDSPKLVRPIFKAASLFLMSSRMVLALQYFLVLYQTRHHNRARRSLTVAVALHLVPAILYLILAMVSYAVQSRALMFAWYGIGAMELIAILIQATMSKTLSFLGTHFNERLNLLTLIIIGEGIIILLKNVTKVVEKTFYKNPDSDWSAALVGIVVCAGAQLYITFQLYFDWMHHHSEMTSIRQSLWALLHLPFHIALVLMSEGGSQWIIWWKGIEEFRYVDEWLAKDIDKVIGTGDTEKIVEALKETTYEILEKYDSDAADGGEGSEQLEEAFDAIAELPNSFWGDTALDETNPATIEYFNNLGAITNSIVNAVSDLYGLSAEEDEKQTASTSQAWNNAEAEAVIRTETRMVLIFNYLFVCAGLVLILLMAMHLISKRRGWSVFNMFRMVLVFVIGAGIALVTLIRFNANYIINFLNSPWQLPAITICYFFVLVLTHLPHPPRIFIRKGEVDMEMARMPENNGESTEYKPSGSAAPPPSAPRAQHQHSSGMGIRRGLTQMHRAARNLSFEPGRYDPIRETDESIAAMGGLPSEFSLYRM